MPDRLMARGGRLIRAKQFPIRRLDDCDFAIGQGLEFVLPGTVGQTSAILSKESMQIVHRAIGHIDDGFQPNATSASGNVSASDTGSVP